MTAFKPKARTPSDKTKLKRLAAAQARARKAKP